MLRITVCLAVALLAAEAPSMAFAQDIPASDTTPPAVRPSKIKLTAKHLKEMRARWVQNRPKMKACRAEAKSKGLTGDKRWFYMEDCMGRT